MRDDHTKFKDDVTHTTVPGERRAFSHGFLGPSEPAHLLPVSSEEGINVSLEAGLSLPLLASLFINSAVTAYLARRVCSFI